MPTADQPSDSLLAALAKAQIPAGNHEFISRIATAIGIASYRAVIGSTKPHVVASRRDGLPDLRIHYGYTAGFTTEDEITRSVGQGAERAVSPGKKTWYVVHPINRVGPKRGRSSDKRREAEFCACGMQLSLTGGCDYCD
jgi:hypothetical protein